MLTEKLPLYFLFFAPQAIFWFKFYKFWRKSKAEEAKRLLHEKKHNCVVSYSPITGCRGYINACSTIPPSINNLDLLAEPILYFLGTAKYQIDIAVMTITMESIFAVLKQKLRQGLNIRILVDSEGMVNNKNLILLQKLGADVKIYGAKDAIMHFKFAIKDCCVDEVPEEENKYYPQVKNYPALIVGSMNWTSKSLYENFDLVVLTSVPSIVENYHQTFELVWNKIKNVQ